MDFFLALLKVIGGTFLLFLIANSFIKPATADKPFGFYLLLAFLTFGTMVFYRQTGHTINVPSYTVLAFIIVLGGMDANFTEEFAERAKKVLSRGRWFAAGGGLAGWLTFAEVVKV